MTRARFLVDPADVREGRARLTGAELRHLRVRRLCAGSDVTLFDRHGTEYRGRVARVGADVAEIDIIAEARPQRESPLRITLAQAVLKGTNLALVIEKATELGVVSIILFTSHRSVGRPPASRRERWERIAAGAAKQSGRVVVPEISGPLDFEVLLARIRDTPAPALLFHPDDGHGPPLRPARPRGDDDRTPGKGVAISPRDLTIVIGPEGGFTDGELDLARAAGCLPTTLGPRVLRAETAAVATTAIAQALWGDLGRLAG